MSPTNAEVVRRLYDVMNRSDSVDAVMAELGPVLDPEVEFVNPPDAVESGTRRGPDGMRAALASYLAGVGPDAEFEIEELLERGDRVFVSGFIHARGTTSGIEIAGPGVGLIYTFRAERLRRLEWLWDKDEARARFEAGR